MPRQLVRFLHAQGLQLDRPVPGASQLSEGHRQTVLQAPFVALQRLVEEAIQREVDWVLLGGETFIEADRSVAARIALARAISQLTEVAIPVFIAPGRSDPADAWTAFPGLPEAVTLLSPDPSGDGPHIVERDEEPVASIEYWHQPLNAPRRSASRSSDSPWRIAVLAESAWPGIDADDSRDDRTETVPADLPANVMTTTSVDYFALAMPGPRRTQREGGAVAHAPGAAIPDGWEDSSATGATCVTLDEAGHVDVEFVPLSPFTRLDVSLPLEQFSSEERLVQAMQQAILNHEPQQGQSLLLVRWSPRGRGPLAASLRDREYRDLLGEMVGDAARPGLQLAHLWSEPAAETSPPDTTDDPLARQAFELLQTRPAISVQDVLHEARISRLAPREREIAVAEEPERIVQRAAQLLDEWLAPAHDEREEAT